MTEKRMSLREALKQKFVEMGLIIDSLPRDINDKVLDAIIEVFKQFVDIEGKELVKILSLPNMGDVGRKAKLITIKEWQVRFYKKFGLWDLEVKEIEEKK